MLAFYHPDCTVGFGITPNHAFCKARGLLPPVGNRTLPQRLILTYEIDYTTLRQDMQVKDDKLGIVSGIAQFPFRIAMVCRISEELNTAEPATKILAPAALICAALVSQTPPST